MIKSNKRTSSDSMKLRGFFRIQISEAGQVKGDSGWKENQVTNLGINQYVVNWLLGDTANGKSIGFMALGTGAAPASDATALPGEIAHTANARKSVATSVVSSRTAQFTAAFNSADSFVTTTINVANVGLFQASAVTAGTIFAGNTFASSTLAVNQNVNVTYQIRFS